MTLGWAGHTPIAKRYGETAREQHQREQMTGQRERPHTAEACGRLTERYVARIAGMADQAVNDHQIARPNDRRGKEAIKQRGKTDPLAVRSRMMRQAVSDNLVRHCRLSSDTV